MRDHSYRVVSCTACFFSDYYQVGTRPSYPPRCPACGEAVDATQFITAEYSPAIRGLLGRDNGIRSIFGDPNADYKMYGDRRWR